MTELFILKLFLIIYWIVSVSYCYTFGMEVSKRRNVEVPSHIAYKVTYFIMSIAVGWIFFPIHLGIFIATKKLE